MKIINRFVFDVVTDEQIADARIEQIKKETGDFLRVVAIEETDPSVTTTDDKYATHHFHSAEGYCETCRYLLSQDDRVPSFFEEE